MARVKLTTAAGEERRRRSPRGKERKVVCPWVVMLREASPMGTPEEEKLPGE
jgi:hypothetical protein